MLRSIQRSAGLVQHISREARYTVNTRLNHDFFLFHSLRSASTTSNTNLKSLVSASNTNYKGLANYVIIPFRSSLFHIQDSNYSTLINTIRNNRSWTTSQHLSLNTSVSMRHFSVSLNPDDAHKDYYKELGVSETASADTIKSSYRKLALEYHPDRNIGKASALERFKTISHAYQILSNPKLREEYDLMRGYARFTGRSSGDSSFGPSFRPDDGGMFKSMFGDFPIDEVMRKIQEDMIKSQRRGDFNEFQSFHDTLLNGKFTFTQREQGKEVKKTVYMRADGVRVLQTETTVRYPGGSHVTVEEEILPGTRADFEELNKALSAGFMSKILYGMRAIGGVVLSQVIRMTLGLIVSIVKRAFLRK
mmetsp:Transcript_4589/g.8018  ORF Transcript_4589/g.8018 Transcript_4589/m.8018 type:complete len:363 (-) Transcript_4589:2413-3501(-)